MLEDRLWEHLDARAYFKDTGASYSNNRRRVQTRTGYSIPLGNQTPGL